MKGIPDGFYAIQSYTNGHVIIVEGQLPNDLSEADWAHNCDEMGCGMSHIVARIPVLEPTPELEWARLSSPPMLQVPSEDEDA